MIRLLLLVAPAACFAAACAEPPPPPQVDGETVRGAIALAQARVDKAERAVRR